jgi:integrase/recombinase XerD
MTTSGLPATLPSASRLLTAEQFQRLADVPPEIEWFANLGNKATRRAYENALGDFMKFTGIVKPEEFGVLVAMEQGTRIGFCHVCGVFARASIR